MDSQERFGVNLRRARLKQGLTQEELGQRSKLDRTEISLLERGGREPRTETVVKLAEVLKTTANDLYAGIRWSEAERRILVTPAALPPPRIKRPRGRPPSR